MASRTTEPENASGKSSRTKAADEKIVGSSLSNSAERAKIIAEVNDELNALAKERADISEREKEQKARIKALGLTMKDFNKARHVANLEEETDKQASMDGFWECMRALGCGDQSDWLKQAGEDTADSKVKAALEMEAKAAGYCGGLGREAYEANKRLPDNPFPEGTKPHKLWEKGYLKAQEKKARAMGPSAGQA